MEPLVTCTCKIWTDIAGAHIFPLPLLSLVPLHVGHRCFFFVFFNLVFFKQLLDFSNENECLQIGCPDIHSN